MQPVDVIDRFLDRAASTPDHVAVAGKSGAITYGLLEDRVRRLAAAVAQYTAPRVLIALPQGADAYAAMLAVGLAGGFYIPINIAIPAEKLQRIVDAVQPTLVIYDDALTPDLLATIAADATATVLLNLRDMAAHQPLDGSGTRHETAYIIFTSGSTGLPKGVVIPRSALNHYIHWAVDALSLGAADRVSQHPNIGFDLSVLDIYAALCAGATLCPLQRSGDRMMPARFIADQKITVWISVPSVVSLMRDARQIDTRRLQSVRLFLFCGEPLLRDHLDDLFAACPEAVVLNTYGPTESTVSVTSIRLDAQNYRDACRPSAALGTPIPGTGLHLVGGRHPDEGEVVLSGQQLASGYWNDPARTAERFRLFDASGVSARGYFTGDWAERWGDLLFFRERTDFQVKLHGYRIELDEVAAAIRACGWQMVCVFVRQERLIAVVEARDDAVLDAAALRKAVADKIESYAVPSEFCLIDRMPRNLNDKLDRSAVLQWYGERAARKASSHGQMSPSDRDLL